VREIRDKDLAFRLMLSVRLIDILLDHQPKGARRAAALGVALQLSGHTHSGVVLGLDRLAARANSGYVSGRYQVEGMTLYVNNGTGLWPGFALRLGRPSELTRITLRRADAIQTRCVNGSRGSSPDAVDVRSGM